MELAICPRCSYSWYSAAKSLRCSKCRRWFPYARVKAIKKETHGLTGTPTWSTYMGVKQRCENPLNPRWSSYGGRGITVEWRSIEDFVLDMGIRPQGMTLDRIDTNGNYSRENCRWADRLQQQNNMRTNVFLEHDGNRMTISQWARFRGISRGVLNTRLRRGWSVERALNTLKEIHSCTK